MQAIGKAKRIDLLNFLNQPRPVAAKLLRRQFSGRDKRYDIVGFRLFAHIPGLVGIIADVSDELLVSIWNMNDKTCKPVEGVEGLFGPCVLGLVYDLGRAVDRFFRWYIEHSLLGETGPDDVPGQVSESGFVLRPNPSADVNMDARGADKGTVTV